MLRSAVTGQRWPFECRRAGVLLFSSAWVMSLSSCGAVSMPCAVTWRGAAYVAEGAVLVDLGLEALEDGGVDHTSLACHFFCRALGLVFWRAKCCRRRCVVVCLTLRQTLSARRHAFWLRLGR
jgi:hypothetical protein